MNAEDTETRGEAAERTRDQKKERKKEDVGKEDVGRERAQRTQKGLTLELMRLDPRDCFAEALSPRVLRLHVGRAGFKTVYPWSLR